MCCHLILFANSIEQACYLRSQISKKIIGQTELQSIASEWTEWFNYNAKHQETSWAFPLLLHVVKFEKLIEDSISFSCVWIFFLRGSIFHFSLPQRKILITLHFCLNIETLLTAILVILLKLISTQEINAVPRLQSLYNSIQIQYQHSKKCASKWHQTPRQNDESCDEVVKSTVRCIGGGRGNFDFQDAMKPFTRGCVITNVCYQHSSQTWSIFDIDENDQTFLRRRLRRSLLDVGNTIVNSNRTNEKIPQDRFIHFSNRRNVKHTEV